MPFFKVNFNKIVIHPSLYSFFFFFLNWKMMDLSNHLNLPVVLCNVFVNYKGIKEVVLQKKKALNWKPVMNIEESLLNHSH